MRTIAVLNQKGGVGKTTTSVNLSAALADQGRRVCLIDLDAQAHASLHLGILCEEDEPSVYDVLTAGVPLAEARREVNHNLSVVPSHINLAAAEMELASEVGREMVLRDRLAEDPEEFEYVIIDCAPSLGLLTLNALTAVTEVFLPLQPHFLALHGLSKLLKTVNMVSARINPNLRLTGVVLCMYERGTRLASEVDQDVVSFFEQDKPANCAWADAVVMQTRIRRNIRLAEAPSHGQSIFQYDPTSNGAEDYRELAAEVIASESAQDGSGEPAATKPTKLFNWYSRVDKAAA